MPRSATSQAIRNFAGAKNEPARPVQIYLDKLMRAHTASAVLTWLDEGVRAFSIGNLGIWELPSDFEHQIERWHLGVNLFIHPDIPGTFWPKYREQHRIHGPSAMSHMIRHASAPFTFAEAERHAKRRGWRNRWVFDLFRSYGFNDGLYCTSRRWIACFVSPVQIVIGSNERMFIQAIATRAFARLEHVKRIPMVHRKKTNLILTEREAEVLQALALHPTNAAAGRVLNISADTVATHLKNARSKLKLSTHQVFMWALKEGVINY